MARLLLPALAPALALALALAAALPADANAAPSSTLNVPSSSGSISISPPVPATVMWDGGYLVNSKARLVSPSSPLRPSLNALVGWADHWADEADHNRTFSVVTKPKAGPSGDPHDFFSLGTYWWPDPSKPNGLPYMRKDGLVNPETFLYDSVPLSQMIFAVSNLSLAHYFTNDERCAT